MLVKRILDTILEMTQKLEVRQLSLIQTSMEDGLG